MRSALPAFLMAVAALPALAFAQPSETRQERRRPAEAQAPDRAEADAPAELRRGKPATFQDAPNEPDKLHVGVYRKVAPAVVFVKGGGQSGSGVVIDREGVILTSPTACGTSSENVSVLLKGQRQLKGKVMGRVNEKELVLIKVDAKDLPFVELGDSDAVRVGQVSYVFGDSFESIQRDDQPAVSMGVVSGIYEVRKKNQKGASWTGKVIETSAAVNPEEDGGPLVDRQGRLLGVVTLNYDDSKFTGLAVPINELKADIERIRKDYAGTPVVVEPAKPAEPAAPRSTEIWFGADVKAVEGGLEVTRVSVNGPAAKAGLRKGDVVLRADSVRALTRAALDRVLEKKKPGDELQLSVRRDGETKDLAVTLIKKPIY